MPLTDKEIGEIADVIGIEFNLIADRDPAVLSALRWFSYRHLPAGPVQDVSARFARVASTMLILIPSDDVELTRGLNKLTEAKDAFVRAAIASQKPA